jgi:hypothetical protein
MAPRLWSLPIFDCTPAAVMRGSEKWIERSIELMQLQQK